MIIQFLVIVFALFVIIELSLRLKRGKISLRLWLFWFGWWVAISVAFLLPKIALFLGQILGISRMAEVLVYLAIMLVFYLVFKIFVRLGKIESNITTIIREIALKNNRETK